jgi:hypothetical protein
VPPPGEAAADALRRYVEGGGGVIVFLGEEAGDGVDFNRMLFADGAGILPFALEGAPQRAGSEGFQMVRIGEHPVTAIFPTGAALSEYVRFRGFYRCVESAPAAPNTPTTSTSAPARPAAVVLARFSDATQSAALVERPLGRGRVLLFTSTADLDWNDWARATDGSYVVTMLELVQYAARRGDDPSAFAAGQPLSVTVSADDYEPVALVKPPDYPDQPATEARVRDMGNLDAPVVMTGPTATHVGVYTFELTRRGVGPEPRPVCVNVDSSESDLTAARAAELIAALAPIPAEFVRAADSFLESGEQTRRELWPSLLLALVTILMMEQTLAWRFGTPGRVARRTA